MSLEPQAPEVASVFPNRSRRKTTLAPKALFLLVVFALGFGSGYFTGRGSMQTDSTAAESAKKNNTMPQMDEINPPAGYTIPVVFGDIGPQMLATGAIDLPRFTETYKQAGQPLSVEQLAILTKGSNSPIVISQKNAYFLLNFFWAFGLTNKNPILTEGQMMSGGKDKPGNF